MATKSANKRRSRFHLIRGTKHVQEQHISMPDGTKIYTRVFQQPTAAKMPLILHDGLGCDGYIWKYIIDHFQADHPIIHWNYRGHGKSEMPRDINSIRVDMCVRDLEVILDRLNIDQAIFCGHSMGVQVVLESYIKLSKKFAAMVLLNGGPGHPIETWHAPFNRYGRTTVANFLMRQFYKQFSGTLIHFSDFIRVLQPIAASPLAYYFTTHLELNPKRVKKSDFFPYLQQLAKMDPRAFGQMMRSLANHNVKQLLPNITHPTFVVSGGRDTFCPGWLSEDMHRAIPKSEHLYIADGSHVTPIEHPELINLRMAKFIHERVLQSAAVHAKVAQQGAHKLRAV